MILVLFFVSCVGGFFSGLLGVGGAVLLIPLLLTVPPLIGVAKLSVHEVAGITMMQVLLSSFFGCISHGIGGYSHKETIFSIGIPMGIFSLMGSILSKRMNGNIMILIFTILVFAAFILLFKKASDEHENSSNEFEFKKIRSVLIGSSVGFASGILGAGGGFIIIPLMVRLLNIPMKIAVGSSLGIIFIGALMGSVGKIITLQVEWKYLLPVILGTLPASILGAQISKKLSPKILRCALMAVIFLVLLNSIKDLLFIFLGKGFLSYRV